MKEFYKKCSKNNLLNQKIHTLLSIILYHIGSLLILR